MKRKAMAKSVRNLQRLRDHTGIWNTTFSPVPSEFKSALEADLKCHFENWWDSWIAPELEILAKELEK